MAYSDVISHARLFLFFLVLTSRRAPVENY